VSSVILLVDDEPSIQRAATALLRTRGYSVVVAGSGAEALEAFEPVRPAVVILDLGLPDMDGVRDPSTPRYVLTEPWVGYRFTEESD
jgi:DNA-binding response OmpR family regulator